MRVRRLVLALTVLPCLAVSLPLAAEQTCYDNDHRQPDPNSTAAWQQSLQAADERAMQMMTGVWYGEIPAPELGMVSYQYQSYEAGGLFQYRDHTCSSTGCSDNQGTGRGRRGRRPTARSSPWR